MSNTANKVFIFGAFLLVALAVVIAGILITLHPFTLTGPAPYLPTAIYSGMYLPTNCGAGNGGCTGPGISANGNPNLATGQGGVNPVTNGYPITNVSFFFINGSAISLNTCGYPNCNAQISYNLWFVSQPNATLVALANTWNNQSIIQQRAEMNALGGSQTAATWSQHLAISQAAVAYNKALLGPAPTTTVPQSPPPANPPSNSASNSPTYNPPSGSSSGGSSSTSTPTNTAKSTTCGTGMYYNITTGTCSSFPNQPGPVIQILQNIWNWIWTVI